MIDGPERGAINVIVGAGEPKQCPIYLGRFRLLPSRADDFITLATDGFLEPQHSSYLQCFDRAVGHPRLERFSA